VEFDSAALVGALDRAGAVAFAISGVQAGVRRNFDIFGLWVMGLVTATGGGVMRDVILDRPPLILARPDYLLWASAGAILAMVLAWRGRPYPRLLLALAETGGLGAFAVAGSLAAINTGQGWSGALLMAILTATGGGVIRDLLADRVPLVLHSEVNATAAGLGRLATWAAFDISSGTATLLGLSVTALVRAAGVAFNLHLPRPPRSGSGRRERDG